MSKIISSIISYFFHPLVITTYIFGLLLFQYPQLVYSIREDFKLHFLGSIFVMTFLVPGLIAFMLTKLGYVSSLKMEKLEDRMFPFLFTTLVYSVDAFLFYKIFKSDLLLTIILGFILLNMLFIGLISLKWKISAHASGVGGLLAFYILASYLNANQFDMYLCISIVLIAGSTISARLFLNSHNIAQVVAGFLLGLLTGLACFFLF